MWAGTHGAVFAKAVIFGVMLALAPAPGAQGSLSYYGVNLAGAEFSYPNPARVPGTEGTDYFHPTLAEVSYFQSKGMNTIRLPFLWERIQPDLNAGFNTTEFGWLTEFVTAATVQGAHVILDVHNYGGYLLDGVRYPIGSTEVTNTMFADFWAGVGGAFASNPNVMFGLMNEPEGTPFISTENWFNAAQSAVNAIRGAGAPNTILVSGNYYSGAWSWISGNGNGTPNAQVMVDIVDPGVNDSGKNLIYEVHQYLDENYSGTSPNIAHTADATLTAFTNWLRTTGNLGFLGEFGVGVGEEQEIAVTGMLNFLEANSDVWTGWTWWAGGPKWEEGYFLDLSPVDGVDAPQMAYLEPFLPVVPEPPTFVMLMGVTVILIVFGFLRKHRERAAGRPAHDRDETLASWTIPRKNGSAPAPTSPHEQFIK